MTTPQIAEHDVLVIGAGPAGINAAYALEQVNISYKVVDKAEIVGSTWASLYPSLDLNTSRWFSTFPEKNFPLSYGVFPSGKQYYSYLAEFVQEHDFNIQLGVTVEQVSRKGQWWQVEIDDASYLYKAVISATGIFNNPIMPQIEGMADFGGILIHASDFKDDAQVANKRVLVVGNGPSGVDISVAAGKVANAAHIAIRSGVMLKRRYPFGIPKHLWLMLGERLPDAWCKNLMSFIGKQDYGDTSQYGLLPPSAGSGGMTAYAGPELLDAVKRQDVTPVQAAPTRFDEHGAHFNNGEYHEYDVVIMATGYEPVLHQYLDVDLQYNPDPWQPQSICDWQIGPNGQRGFPLRDTSEHPNGRQILGHEGLYLVGVFYKGKGAMYNMTVEANIAAEQIQRYLVNWQDSPEKVMA